MSFSIHPLMDTEVAIVSFQPWAMLQGIQEGRYLVESLLSFLQINTQEWIAGSYGSSIFCFLRNPQTVLHSGHTSWHSPQQHKRFPFSPHSCQHLLSLSCWSCNFFVLKWNPCSWLTPTVHFTDKKPGFLESGMNFLRSQLVLHLLSTGELENLSLFQGIPSPLHIQVCAGWGGGVLINSLRPMQVCRNRTCRKLCWDSPFRRS